MKIIGGDKGMGIADLNADERNNLPLSEQRMGMYLKTGFNARDKITVDCQQGRLVITKDKTRADSRE